MTYYFMPRIDGLRSEVTLANYAPTDDRSAWSGPQILHAAWTDGKQWILRDLGSIATDAAFTISQSELPSDLPAEALPVLMLNPSSLTGRHDRLPLLAHMETVPAWRANICIKSAGTSVSYQGEYPASMTMLEKASLLSIAPLIQTGAGITTTLLFLNVMHRPDILPHALDIVASPACRSIRHATIHTNRQTSISLDGLDLPSDRIYAAHCETISGIPLYFSYDRSFTQMSLEHSHPPIEYAVFGNRGAVNRKLKARWSALRSLAS